MERTEDSLEGHEGRRHRQWGVLEFDSPCVFRLGSL